MPQKEFTYNEYLEGSRRILENSQQEKRPYHVIILGKRFIVYPNVFSPKYFRDTRIFAKHLPITKESAVLEIGPGTGVLSIVALYKGAQKVVAVDINEDAVKNTLENAKRHDLEDRISVRKGDVYSALDKAEKFDLIFWNVPFGYVQQVNLSDLERALYDHEYQSIRRFIREASEHLKKDGRLIIGFSSSLGKFELLENIAKDAGYKLVCIHKQWSKEDLPVYFELFEAIKI
jgi:16S rRNA G1207 methylase RsmC